MRTYSRRWFSREWPVLFVLLMLVGFTAADVYLIGREIKRDDGQEDASGIGNASISSPSRPVACQKARQPQANETRGSDDEDGQQMALRNYCVAVRANELSSRTLVAAGWGAIVALLTMAFSVIALVVSIRTGRAAIGKGSD